VKIAAALNYESWLNIAAGVSVGGSSRNRPAGHV